MNDLSSSQDNTHSFTSVGVGVDSLRCTAFDCVTDVACYFCRGSAIISFDLPREFFHNSFYSVDVEYVKSVEILPGTRTHGFMSVDYGRLRGHSHTSVNSHHVSRHDPEGRLIPMTIEFGVSGTLRPECIDADGQHLRDPYTHCLNTVTNYKLHTNTRTLYAHAHAHSNISLVTFGSRTIDLQTVDLQRTADPHIVILRDAHTSQIEWLGLAIYEY